MNQAAQIYLGVALDMLDKACEVASNADYAKLDAEFNHLMQFIEESA